MKRLFAVLLAIALMMPTVACVAASAPSEWAKSGVDLAKNLGIARDTYEYQSAITREDFCELIYNYIELTNTNFNYENNKFTDTENQKIIALFNLGIINGRSEDKFEPNATLTREEAATILARVVTELRPLRATGMTGNWIVFYDEDEFSPWAKFNIQNMYKYGVMGGVGVKELTIGVTGGSESITTRPVFDPKGIFTAEEAITTVVRLYEMTKEESIVKNGTFADRMNEKMPTDENYMFSPLSVKIALLMAANGATGGTRMEILDSIGVEDIDSYNGKISKMIDDYSKSDLLCLKVANSIWLNSDNVDGDFTSDFKSLMSDNFNATAKKVNSVNAVNKVNSWVKDATRGKIPTIISSGDFYALLVNAIYFKGRWEDEFSYSQTRKDVFITADKERKTVDFMNKTDWIRVAETDGATIVELPYLTRTENESLDMDVSMYLIMSDDTYMPEKLLSATNFESEYVNLSVPKFKIEFSDDLTNVLKGLGIDKAFKSTADFTNMLKNGGIWVDSVVHKTYIDVNEEGTEAAAVTAMLMAGSALPPKPRDIKFDKPFTFVIKDNINGEILFMGKYAY